MRSEKPSVLPPTGFAATVKPGQRIVTTDLIIEIPLGATGALVNPEKPAQRGVSAKTCLSGIITIFLAGVVTEKGRANP